MFLIFTVDMHLKSTDMDTRQGHDRTRTRLHPHTLFRTWRWSWMEDVAYNCWCWLCIIRIVNPLPRKP